MLPLICLHSLRIAAGSSSGPMRPAQQLSSVRRRMTPPVTSPPPRRQRLFQLSSSIPCSKRLFQWCSEIMFQRQAKMWPCNTHRDGRSSILAAVHIGSKTEAQSRQYIPEARPGSFLFYFHCIPVPLYQLYRMSQSMRPPPFSNAPVKSYWIILFHLSEFQVNPPPRRPAHRGSVPYRVTAYAYCV